MASYFCWLAVLVVGGQSASFAQDAFESRVLVSTREHAVLSGELAARIENIAVRPGASFKKGDLLIAFDCQSYKAQRATVAADLRRADAQLKSQQRLFELRSVGELDVIMAESARDSAKAQLQLQDVYLDRCKINAPYDGVVVEWRSQPYQIANPGDEIIEIIGSGNLELELIVPSQWLSWLTVGDTFKARIDETGMIVTARTERIGSLIDAVSQTVKVFAVLDDKEDQLLPGMSGIAIFDPKP
ncbi:efflux RND transporter periplasmic adaptor subunit [Thalassospira sp. MIT1370]|uniref:efflux RND transporter periplasmic adaptor subunit n=1 Tax=unclassified Thalassospira TaxID=2648997 RepID=UPI00399AF159